MISQEISFRLINVEYNADSRLSPHLLECSVEPEHNYWETDPHYPGAAVNTECYLVHS